MIVTHLWRPYHWRDIDKPLCLKKIQRRATKHIPELRDLSCEERVKEWSNNTGEATIEEDQTYVFFKRY